MAHGVACAAWAVVQNPPYSRDVLEVTLFLGPNAHCRPQQSKGMGKDVTLGSLKAEQEPMSPSWCGQLDVTKTGSWPWQHEHFPSLWQQPIFVLFRYEYPANTLKVMPWDAPFSGLIWSNRLLRTLGHVESHQLWCLSSCVLLHHLQDHSGWWHIGQINTSLAAQRYQMSYSCK